MVLEALNVGMLMMSRSPEDEVEKAILAFVTHYGLLGLMTALPTTPSFMDYEAVYLPKNHFIKEECMETEGYLALFYPFDKLDTVEHIAETLERLRSSLIMLQYRLLVNHKQADTWKRQVSYYRPILQDYHAVTQQLSDKKSEQEQLQTNRNAVPLLQIAQRRQLAEQIAALTEEIEELRSRQAMILHNLECKNSGEAQRFGSYLDKLEEMQARLISQRETLMQQYSENMAQYIEVANTIPPRNIRAVRHCRAALRPEITAEREYLLVAADNFDLSAMQYAERFVDAQIKDNICKSQQKMNRHPYDDMIR